MARPPRALIVKPGYAVHKVWTGHNWERNLGSDENKHRYMEIYNDDVENGRYQQGATLQAATLMSNHDHEVAHVTEVKLFSNQMRRHHGRYGAYFNKVNNRRGKVAMGRPHTTLLESEVQEMETVFYVHANPVRANIVRDAKDYKWSTHRLYAFGKQEPWMRNIKLPGWYMRFGRTPALRQRKYRSLFDRYLRDKGRFKQKFLRNRFFGSPLWVAKQEIRISAWRKARGASP